jgi:pimeloyl-ACP methyl ester carboxylesterase
MADTDPVAELDQRFSRLDATASPWPVAREILERAEVYWLTTVRPDGRPHVTPLIGVWVDGERGYKGGLIMTGKSDEERPPTPDSEVRPAGSGERIVRANGVDICVETFGDPAEPPILLIMGGASSMDWWEDAFCERLMAGSRFVIRYDHRDTGRSISYEPGAAPYSLRDLADDAVGLLDAFGLESAHLVGMSVGGWIGQLVALENPDRVASLTLISTSPTAGPSDPDLPEMSQELQAFFAEEASEPDWSDREAVIDYIVEGERPFAGSRPFDEAAIRAIAARVFDRTTNLASSITNHAAIDSGDRWRERLGEVSVPTLVIHGTEDPMYPYGNAVALVKEIPGAQLLALERVGHEVPPRALWDVVVPAILQLTVSAP